MRDHTGPYSTIQDHSELFQADGAVSNFFVTHSLTGATFRGACAPKNENNGHQGIIQVECQGTGGGGL